MDNILPRYDITIQDDFVFLDKKDIEQFMFSDLKAHSHNYYILSFLYEGSVSHLSDFEQEKVPAPAILMLDLDQVHTHPDITDCTMVSIGFSTNFISDQQQKFLQKVGTIFSRPSINISDEELDKLDEIIKIMARESVKKNRDYELIKALLNVLIVNCYNLSETYAIVNKPNKKFYNDFKSLLQENFRKEHNVKFYADLLHISTRVLTQCVKSSTFKTPKQLIDQHLILEAKRLLYWSNASVKEVAWELGFETDSYFNRFFKKHTGKTPKEFNQKHFED